MISEYGAAIWCDQYRWIPEAARLLRPGGRLVLLGGSVQIQLCLPDQGPATGPDGPGPVRALPGTWPGEDGVEFCLPHGERIRLLRSCGLEVEDLIEVWAPADATNTFIPEITLDRARRWPSEELRVARRRV